MMDNKYVKKEYDMLAPEYDSRWAGYLKSTHGVALRLADPCPHDSVLDASGGTGLLAEQMMHVIGQDGRLTLIDISDGMLDVAEQRLRRYQNIKILRNDVHDLLFEKETFTKVLSVSALHYYADPKKAISEFHQVLQPGGSIIMIDWCRDPLHFKVFDKVIKVMNKSHVRIHTSDELKGMLIGEGFRIDVVERWSYGLWSLMGIRAVKSGIRTGRNKDAGGENG